MNAILGSIDNEQLSPDVENLLKAHMQADQLLMNIIMKSVDQKTKEYVDKAVTSAVAHVLINVANAMLGGKGVKRKRTPEEHRAQLDAARKKSWEDPEIRARRIESLKKSWENKTEEQREEARKHMREGHRKRWDSATEEQRAEMHKLRSEASRKIWESLSEEQRKAQIESMRNGWQSSSNRRVDFNDLPEDEQDMYTAICESKLIAETFILRECRCLNEANHLIGQYLRNYSRENKFKNVHGKHAMYDNRAIEWLCNGYKDHTLDEATYGSLSYYFE